MGDFFKRNKFRFLLCILALLTGMLLYAATQNGQTTGVTGMILNPLRQVTHSISTQVDRFVSSFTDATGYQKENETLKQENAALKKQLLDYEDTKQQLAELEKFMGIKEDHPDYTLSDPCTIIGYVTNDPFHSFIIDKGSEDGLSLQDPAVTAEGIVGIISEVSNTYATVETICSPNLSIGAMSATGSDTGIVEGEISLASDYQCRMIYLERDTKLEKDSLIKTSGTSGLFPQGYLIGTVERLELMDSGLSKYAVLKPSVDFSSLTNVMVILDYDGKDAEANTTNQSTNAATSNKEAENGKN